MKDKLINLTIDNCRACEPIEKLYNEFLKKGFKVQKLILQDYHFHELFIQLKGGNYADSPKVSGISKIENKFICDCHWSTIELIFE